MMLFTGQTAKSGHFLQPTAMAMGQNVRRDFSNRKGPRSGDSAPISGWPKKELAAPLRRTQIGSGARNFARIRGRSASGEGLGTSKEGDEPILFVRRMTVYYRPT